MPSMATSRASSWRNVDGTGGEDTDTDADVLNVDRESSDELFGRSIVGDDDSDSFSRSVEVRSGRNVDGDPDGEEGMLIAEELTDLRFCADWPIVTRFCSLSAL